jgi:hypothetical protein
MTGRTFQLFLCSLAACGSFLAACSSGSETAEVLCTLESRPAIVVTATESATGQPVRGFTATLSRTDGYLETQTASATDNIVALAFEGRNRVDGTYDVKVTRSGYQDWLADDVFVAAGECHVETVALEAAMRPL